MNEKKEFHCKKCWDDAGCYVIEIDDTTLVCEKCNEPIFFSLEEAIEFVSDNQIYKIYPSYRIVPTFC